jgi:hypothetical protein
MMILPPRLLLLRCAVVLLRLRSSDEVERSIYPSVYKGCWYGAGGEGGAVALVVTVKVPFG